MKTPPYLKDKDTISLVAPSFGCTIEPYRTRLLEAVKVLKKLNYEIDLGANCFKGELPYASTIATLRAKEFMTAYQSNSKVIISVGGGELMQEILPYIDFEAIKSLPPKWFMGFSDNTNLTYTLTTISHIETIYGVNACDFAFYPFTNATKDTYEILCGKLKVLDGYPYFEKEKIKDPLNPLAPSHLNALKKIKANSNTSKVYGRLLGGNLDILQNICGTKFDQTKKFLKEYPNEKIIWFLEACDLSPIGIKRAINQLIQAEWFDNVGAFLIGRSLCMDDVFLGVNAYSAYDELNKFNVPLYLDVDLGHMPPSMPLICGRCATIEYVSEKHLRVIYD